MRPAAITGLEAEARIARRAGLAARPSGGLAEQTRRIAEALLRDGATALVSFGIAGALAPRLACGSLLLPRAVVDASGARFPVDPARHARARAALADAGLAVEEGEILGAAEPAAAAARKGELHRATQAVAIDLESHLVAEIAARAGRPFLVLRAVADIASQSLPPAALVGLAPSGRPALGRVLVSLARQPAQITALLRLAGDTRHALAALGLALRAQPF